jgi:enoyl-CoA hydratase/carnithine racemase
MTGDAGPAVLTRREGAVGHVVLNRPAAMNAITVELGELLHAGLAGLAGDPEVSVIVIRGAGGNFCVGGDFYEVERLRAGGRSGLAPLFERFGRACEVIATLEVPVVAAVEGYAMAGGFELLMAADIVIVAGDARLADNHTNFGQIPGGGSTQRLARLVGRQRALGLILTGDRISGQQAAAWGLAYRSCPPDGFDATLADLVAKLAGKDRVAAGEIKRLVRAGLELPLTEGLALERSAVIDFIAGDAGAAAIERSTKRGA